MEFGHRAAVFGDHPHLTSGCHLIHQAEAAGLELGGTDGVGHGLWRKPPEFSPGTTMVMTMVMFDEGVQQAWLAGARRRSNEVTTGAVKQVPAEQLFTNLRNRSLP
jgi:hypothetical protein